MFAADRLWDETSMATQDQQDGSDIKDEGRGRLRMEWAVLLTLDFTQCVVEALDVISFMLLKENSQWARVTGCRSTGCKGCITGMKSGTYPLKEHRVALEMVRRLVTGSDRQE